MHRWMTDPLWYQINLQYFTQKKVGIKLIITMCFFLLYFSVCVNVVKQFKEQAPNDLYDKSPNDIEQAFMKFCEEKKGKEERFVRII